MISRKTFRNILKYLVFTFIFFIFCALQTSFWSVLIDFLPAPQFWLMFLVYIFLKWPTNSTIFYAYFLGYVLTLFSSMPLKMVWLSTLGLCGFVLFFKNRIQSTSLFLFSVLCGASSLFYSVLYVSISSSVETNATSVLFLDRVLQVGLTFLVSAPIYFVLHTIDHFFKTTETWSSDSQGISVSKGEL